MSLPRLKTLKFNSIYCSVNNFISLIVPCTKKSIERVRVIFYGSVRLGQLDWASINNDFNRMLQSVKFLKTLLEFFYPNEKTEYIVLYCAFTFLKINE